MPAAVAVVARHTLGWGKRAARPDSGPRGPRRGTTLTLRALEPSSSGGLGLPLMRGSERLQYVQSSIGTTFGPARRRDRMVLTGGAPRHRRAHRPKRSYLLSLAGETHADGDGRAGEGGVDPAGAASQYQPGRAGIGAPLIPRPFH